MEPLISGEWGLTPEEQIEVFEYTATVKLRSFNDVVGYGGGVSSRIAAFSERLVTVVTNSQLLELFERLSTHLKEMKELYSFQKRFFSFKKKKETSRRVKLDIQKTYRLLDQVKVQSLKENALINQYRGLNQNLMKDLVFYIIAGDLKLKDIDKSIDDESLVDAFHTKLNNLRITRQIALQLEAQMELMTRINQSLKEHIDLTFSKVENIDNLNETMKLLLDESLRLEEEDRVLRSESRDKLNDVLSELKA